MIRGLQNWDIHHVRWQDVVAFLAGMWLVATVMAQLSTVSLLTGGLGFIAGALLMLVGAASFQDNSAALSWTLAGAGLLAVIAAVIAVVNGEMLAFWSLAVGGGLALFLEVWSATLKRRESKRDRRPAARRAPIHA